MAQTGTAPSLEEIAENFDFLKYPSSAHYHVKKLEDEGYIEKETGKPRSIGIHADKEVKTPFLKKAGLDSVRVPVLGSANAGPAVLFAEENIQGYLKVSKGQLSHAKNAYALIVDGDSMNEAKVKGKNIEDGDFVLVDPVSQIPKDGDIDVSVLDGCANKKRFRKDARSGRILLESESRGKDYKPIFVSSQDEFLVNGMVVDDIKQ